MTDVLKIAIERRSRLQEEIGKLDDFIQMAEQLMQQSGISSSASAPTAAPAPAAPVAAPAAPAAPVSQSPLMQSAPSEPSSPVGPSSSLDKPENKDVPRPSIIRRGLAAS